MNMEETITYLGKQYPVRTIVLGDDELLIGCDALMLALMPVEMEGGYSSDEAEDIDDTICFYVSDEDILLPDEEIAFIVERDCYDGSY